MAAVLKLDKPLIFACARVETEVAADKRVREGGSAGGVGSGDGGGTPTQVTVVRGNGARHMLQNCACLVNIENAEAAVPADKERELMNIGASNFAQFNRTVAAALDAGVDAVAYEVHEVDAFNCGEPQPLRVLDAARVPTAFLTACAAGQLTVLVELRRMHGDAVAAYLAGNTEIGSKG